MPKKHFLLHGMDLHPSHNPASVSPVPPTMPRDTPTFLWDPQSNFLVVCIQFNSIQFNKTLQPYLCKCNKVLVIDRYIRVWLMVRHQQVMLPDTGNVDGYESSDIRLVVHY